MFARLGISVSTVSAIRPGGVCQYGEVCDSGYEFMYLPYIPAGIAEGGDCTSDRDGCVPGLLRRFSPIHGSDRWTCQYVAYCGSTMRAIGQINK